MGSVLRLQVTSPSNTAVTGYITPSTVYVSGEVSKPGRMIATIDTNFDLYYDETEATNPLQLNAYVELDRNGTKIFRGRIFSKRVTRRGNTKSIRIECLDKLGAIAQCMVTITTDAVQYGTSWDTCVGHLLVYAQSAVAVDFIQLHEDTPYNRRWYPDVTDADLWYPHSGTYETVKCIAKNAIPPGDAAILTTTGYSDRMLNQGIAKIVDAVDGDEIFYYEGRSLDATGTYYEFHNIKRGCLGTTEVTHSNPNLVIRQMVPKRWWSDQTADYLITTTGSGEYQAEVNGEEGFLFYGDDIPDTVIADYDYLDETDAGSAPKGNSFYTLATLIEALLENGGLGPDLDSAEHDVDLPLIVMPAAMFSNSYTLDCIFGLMDERGATGIVYDANYTEHPPLGVWYDSQTDLVSVQAIVQSSAARLVIPQQTAVDYELSLDNVFSGEAVRFPGTNWLWDGRVVYLTDTYAAASRTTVLDPTAYSKLVDSTWGIPKAYGYTTDLNTSIAAQDRSLTQLRLSLNLANGRNYQIDRLPVLLPKLGSTYYMPDGYEGVAMRFDYRSEYGTEHMGLYLLDLNVSRRVI